MQERTEETSLRENQGTSRRGHFVRIHVFKFYWIIVQGEPADVSTEIFWQPLENMKKEGHLMKLETQTLSFSPFFFQNPEQKEIRIPKYYRPVSLILISGKIQDLISKRSI